MIAPLIAAIEPALESGNRVLRLDATRCPLFAEEANSIVQQVMHICVIRLEITIEYEHVTGERL